MTDYTELKRLAEAASKGDWSGAKAGEFMVAANPAAILALIAELECPFRLARHSKRLVEALRAEVAGLRTGYEAYERVNADLKAENEALRKDAQRYQWLRDKSESINAFYLSTPIWFSGVKFSKESVDRTIDAAMGKEPLSD